MKYQRSILIFDDEPSVGEMLIDMLSPCYEEVVFTDSALQAKELIHKRSFSLIISDVQMPQLPGPDFVRLVRALGRLEPIIFLTGNATKDLVLSALRLGVSDVIEKPFDHEQFYRSLEHVFEIEKRRNQFFQDKLKADTSPLDLERQRKMLGLLHVVSEKKSS